MRSDLRNLDLLSYQEKFGSGQISGSIQAAYPLASRKIRIAPREAILSKYNIWYFLPT